MKITPVYWTYDKRKDNTCPVKIRYFCIKNNKKHERYYSLGIYIEKNQWDKTNNRVKAHPNAMDINIKIVDILSTVEREYLNNQNVDVELIIKNILTPPTPTIEKETIRFLEYMQYYINECKEGNIVHYKTTLRLSSGYIKTVETSFGRLEWYCNKIKLSPTFNDITENFHNQCMNALRYDYEMSEENEKGEKEVLIGMAENSIGKTTKHLKMVMKHAAKKSKLHTNFAYEDFISVQQDVDNIALTENEISLILDLKLTEKDTKYLISEQERFSIAYNFLLRFNDSLSINKKHIFSDSGNYFLRMMTGKTKQGVIIPIMPRNYEILEKNKFKIKQTNNQNSNERVKELGRLAGLTDDYTYTEIRQGKTKETVMPKYEMISTHTTRRSAATNLYLGGVDLKSIQLMGGWKTLKQLEDYLKIDKLENAKKLASHAFFNR